MQDSIANELSEQTIIEKIYVIRGQKVMLDKDLAEMYGVPTKRLNEAVKRNLSRFPDDFMFQASEEEFEILKSQIATSRFHGGSRKPSNFFTEQGVAMLSSVLHSERAIQVNIRIIRVYTKIRQLLFENKDLWLKLEKIEKDVSKHDNDIKVIFEILKKLIVKEEKPREPIGFKIPKKPT